MADKGPESKPKPKAKAPIFKPRVAAIKVELQKPIDPVDITSSAGPKPIPASAPAVKPVAAPAKTPAPAATIVKTAAPTPIKTGLPPVSEVPKSVASEVPKPVAAEAPKPVAAEAPKPAEEAPKPAEEAPKPAEEAPKPAEEAPKSAEEEIPKPATEVKKTRKYVLSRATQPPPPPPKKSTCGKVPTTEEDYRGLLPPLPRLPPELAELQQNFIRSFQQTPYKETTIEPYVPKDRKAFSMFVTNRFEMFQLPLVQSTKINPNACSEMKMETYKYQAFVREYMRQSSPYPGILVYHGLGSGKTCTSIAAAEALLSQSNKKIIVMTPKSLQENFLDQLMFCGFRHYRLKNVWSSFSIDDSTQFLFAKSIVGLSDEYIAKLKSHKEPSLRVFWMPDLSKPEDETNFDELEDWEQNAIREQIRDVINNKIKFIPYTGYTYDNLMDKVVNDPTFFDNSVIVIDEIHNLTRLMAGKLDRHFFDVQEMQGAQSRYGSRLTDKELKQQRKIQDYYEPVTVSKWVPKKRWISPKERREILQIPEERRTEQQKQDLAMPKSYDRAFLFYMLLVQARNSKIIALSGTPFVNQPVELGILGNLLNGYFHSAKDILLTVDERKIKEVEDLLEKHPRVNFYSISKEQKAGGKELFFTLLKDGYTKVFDEATGEFEGLQYSEEECEKMITIEDLYKEIQQKIKEKGLDLKGTPNFLALPLFWPNSDKYNNDFVDFESLVVKNKLTFAKRYSGLVSYYRGSKEELMPKVIADTVVPCYFSALSQGEYEKVRIGELEADAKRKKFASKAQTAIELSKAETSSYRYKSRAVSNITFPTDIPRPFAKNKAQLSMETKEGDIISGDVMEDLDEKSMIEAEEAEKKVREEDEEAADGEDGEEDAAEGGEEGEGVKLSKKEQKALHAALRKKALDAINARKETLFKMDPSAPEEQQCKTYSSKFAEIYKRIQESPGSSLVYSAFLTTDGIGIFGMVLEANGFQRIKLTGPDTDLQFDEATKESFMTKPDQPRFILYSGEDTIRQRMTLINIFNSRLEKLPAKISEVLRTSKLSETRNLYGQICKVFMITGAGAEGLSLRNVRTVHIMEPYWNKVRTDQVKGRAVRICSHSDLPYSEDPSKNERTVEIFTYIAMFNPKITVSETIMRKDGNQTSDQHIMDLAEAKEKIGNDFLYLMKAGAVDCILNYSENEKQIKCFVQTGTTDDFLYDPRLEIDLLMKDTTKEDIGMPSEAEAPKPTARKIGFKGVEYLVTSDPKTGKDMVYNVTDLFLSKPIGEIQLVRKDGKIFKTIKMY